MSIEIKTMTEDDLKEMISEHNQLNPDIPIREDVKESLTNWAVKGWVPGGFLLAVLENNLMEAMGRADSYNRATIFQICTFIYNELPHDCHGNPEKVQLWHDKLSPQKEEEAND